MPTASASPPSVMTLRVWPTALRIATDVRIESGIDVSTTRVLRQLPRKSRIMTPVKHAAIAPSVSTPVMAARTKSD